MTPRKRAHVGVRQTRPGKTGRGDCRASSGACAPERRTARRPALLPDAPSIPSISERGAGAPLAGNAQRRRLGVVMEPPPFPGQQKRRLREIDRREVRVGRNGHDDVGAHDLVGLEPGPLRPHHAFRRARPRRCARPCRPIGGRRRHHQLGDLARARGGRVQRGDVGGGLGHCSRSPAPSLAAGRRRRRWRRPSGSASRPAARPGAAGRARNSTSRARRRRCSRPSAGGRG
jgi:hypothetical protein